MHTPNAGTLYGSGFLRDLYSKVSARNFSSKQKTNPMNILIACEESQTVCKAFRKFGHEAYSCDLLPCSGGHPEWHKRTDCRNIIPTRKWDLIIFHPDCTYMAVSGNRWYAGTEERQRAIDWTLDTWIMICKHSRKSVLENPVSVIFRYLMPLSGELQYIQPWQFGHGETKKTGLYLRNLPELIPTNIVQGRDPRIWKMPPGKDRKRLRSLTYKGIAKAMAQQWG
jgi:hypothetical protein